MRAILAFAVPVLGLVVVTTRTSADSPAEDPNKAAKAAQAAIISLSQNLDAPDVKERAEKIVREHASENISSTFMRTSHGGLGAGRLAINPNSDGIDRLVRQWQYKGPTTEEISRNRSEMIRIAKIVRAMSELAPYRVPKNARPQVAREWAEVAAEFHETALGLHKAVEKGESTLIRDAAKKLNNTCCHCHGLLD
jgi:hypothetical protein